MSLFVEQMNKQGCQPEEVTPELTHTSPVEAVNPFPEYVLKYVVFANEYPHRTPAVSSRLDDCKSLLSNFPSIPTTFPSYLEVSRCLHLGPLKIAQPSYRGLWDLVRSVPILATLATRSRLGLLEHKVASTTEVYFLSVLGTRSLRSRCGQD